MTMPKSEGVFEMADAWRSFLDSFETAMDKMEEKRYTTFM
jgi:hypothetical protein